MRGAAIDDVLPLAPLQEDMLFHVLYEEHDLDVYASRISVDLDGALDVEAMRAAVAALLRRHANLRAGFRYERLSRPVQVIPRDVPLPWPEVDLRGLDGPLQERELLRLDAEEASLRFGLTAGPLLRFTLVRRGERSTRLMFHSHHILLDGGSTAQLMHELFEIYGRGGDASGLPPVTPYREYLNRLAGRDRAAAGQAWRAHPGDVEHPTLLAPGDAGARTLPAKLLFTMPRDLAGQLRDTARDG